MNRVKDAGCALGEALKVNKALTQLELRRMLQPQQDAVPSKGTQSTQSDKNQNLNR